MGWIASAQNLLRGARLVAPPMEPNATLQDVTVDVQAMLLGYSVECSLKALWLKKDFRYTRSGAGFMRDGKFQLRAMPGALRHDLRRMAVEVGISDLGELELLERLSWFIKWAGRYPVPLNVADILPRYMKQTGKVIPKVLWVNELKEADNLAERLIQESQPWS
jgi:hypothetical protein